ncbi:hypothetical protein [Nucisporomicrobium flavum]|uniref:hypothetical protein n=1 Tax=Nucisporomicrobium flavum TaxID=2785915 RepID=UPI0018F33EE5|nr:hypothetical protein [Nucisporomicrobium flavum]
MRNEVHDDNPAVLDSVVARRNRRRKQALAGVAGLAVLGAGAFAVTSQVTAETRSHDTAAEAPLPAATSSSSAADATSGPASPAAAGPASPAAAGSAPAAAAKPKTTQEQIEAVKGTAAKNTAQRIRRPLAAAVDAVADEDLTVTTIGSLKDDKATIKVVSARLDLTGQRELGWVAGKGEKAGSASCTQKIRVSPDLPARLRPTLLLCWRTSASRSVYTVAVNLTGKPSVKASVAQIDKAWSALS